MHLVSDQMFCCNFPMNRLGIVKEVINEQFKCLELSRISQKIHSFQGEYLCDILLIYLLSSVTGIHKESPVHTTAFEYNRNMNLRANQFLQIAQFN